MVGAGDFNGNALDGAFFRNSAYNYLVDWNVGDGLAADFNFQGTDLPGTVVADTGRDHYAFGSGAVDVLPNSGGRPVDFGVAHSGVASAQALGIFSAGQPFAAREDKAISRPKTRAKPILRMAERGALLPGSEFAPYEGFWPYDCNGMRKKRWGASNMAGKVPKRSPSGPVCTFWVSDRCNCIRLRLDCVGNH